MDKSELKQLQERWGHQQATLGNSVLGGKGNAPFPVTDDEMVDLRGLVITQFIKSATISSVDLSGVSPEGFGQFGMCNISNCRFRFATLPTNLGSSFTSCDFTSAKLTGAVLRGKFVDCDFTSVNLTSVMGNQVKFVRCKFVKSNFRKATLLHCMFEDCVFDDCKFKSGSLAFSNFVRSPIPECDLNDTLMEKVVTT